MYEAMMSDPATVGEFSLARDTVEAEHSFSAEALDETLALIRLWIGTRIMRQWNERNEPPTAITIMVDVEPA